MPFIGEFAAILTAVLWSGTAIAFSEASIRIGSFYVNVTRLIFAVVYLTLTILIFGLDISLSGSQIFYLFGSGVVGLVLGDTYLFKAYQHIGARLSMLLMSSSPAMAALLAYFFLGETISILGIIGMFVTAAGIAMVVFQRQEVPSTTYKIDYSGIVFGLIGALGQAGGLILAKKAFNEGDVNGFVAAFFRIVSALIILYPLTMMTKKFIKPIEKFKSNKPALVFTIIGSIIGPFLGITFSLISITYAKVGIASTLMATVPIIMLPMVKYYYKEKLSAMSIAGAFIAVAGIMVLFLR